MELIKGYKTVLFNVIMAITMVLAQFGLIGPEEITEEDVKAGLNALEMGLTMLWTVGNIWIRAVTDSPIFQSRRRR